MSLTKFLTSLNNLEDWSTCPKCSTINDEAELGSTKICTTSTQKLKLLTSAYSIWKLWCDKYAVRSTQLYFVKLPYITPDHHLHLLGRSWKKKLCCAVEVSYRSDLRITCPHHPSLLSCVLRSPLLDSPPPLDWITFSVSWFGYDLGTERRRFNQKPWCSNVEIE